MLICLYSEGFFLLFSLRRAFWIGEENHKDKEQTRGSGFRVLEENQIEHRMEHEMETGDGFGFRVCPTTLNP